MNHPIITLKSGLCIANFSSPHTFVFDTGEVLEACSPTMAKELVLQIEELETQNPKWVDVKLKISLSEVVASALVTLCDRDDVDVVLVPFMVREAVISTGKSLIHDYDKVISKIRVCRGADRVTKTIFSNRFSI